VNALLMGQDAMPSILVGMKLGIAALTPTYGLGANMSVQKKRAVVSRALLSKGRAKLSAR